MSRLVDHELKWKRKPKFGQGDHSPFTGKRRPTQSRSPSPTRPLGLSAFAAVHPAQESHLQSFHKSTGRFAFHPIPASTPHPSSPEHSSGAAFHMVGGSRMRSDRPTSTPPPRPIRPACALPPPPLADSVYVHATPTSNFPRPLSAHDERRAMHEDSSPLKRQGNAGSLGASCIEAGGQEAARSWARSADVGGSSGNQDVESLQTPPRARSYRYLDKHAASPPMDPRSIQGQQAADATHAQRVRVHEGGGLGFQQVTHSMPNGAPQSRHSFYSLARRSGPSAYASQPLDPSTQPRNSYHTPIGRNSRHRPRSPDGRLSRSAHTYRKALLVPALPPSATSSPPMCPNVDQLSVPASKRIPLVPCKPTQGQIDIQSLLSHRSKSSDTSLCNIGGASPIPGQWIVEQRVGPCTGREVAQRTASGFTPSFEQRNFAVGNPNLEFHQSTPMEFHALVQNSRQTSKQSTAPRAKARVKLGINPDRMVDHELNQQVEHALGEWVRLKNMHEKVWGLQADVYVKAAQEQLAERNSLMELESRIKHKKRTEDHEYAALKELFRQREQKRDVVRVSLESEDAAGMNQEQAADEVVDTEDLSMIRKAIDAEVVRQSKMSIEMKLADGHRHQAVDTATLPGWGEAIKMHIDEKFSLGTGQLDGRLSKDTVDLKLGHCKLNDFHMASISHLLANHPQLTRLELNNNALGNTSVKMLVELLRRQPNIVYLDLSHNPIESHAAEHLGKYLKDCNYLRELHLEGCHLGLKGVSKIAQALHDNSSLTKLGLSHSKLTDDAGVELGKMLLRNGSLLEVNVAWNNMALKSAKAFSEGLQSSKCKVQRIDMSRNAFGDLGGSYLGHAIRHSKRLRLIDLSANSLRESASLVIAHGLRNNTTLEELNLNNNPLGKVGGACILEALSKNSHLQRCGLQQCGFTSMTKSVVFNARRPDRMYHLDMANPTQRHVVTELLELRERVLLLDPAVARGQSASTPATQAAAEEPAGRGKGKASSKNASKEAPSKTPSLPPLDVWDKPSFEGVPVTLADIKEWRERPEFMPFEGTLSVRIKWSTSPPVTPTAMTDTFFKHVIAQLSHPSSNDKWRMQFIKLVTDVKYMTSEQAAEMLTYLNWGAEKVETILMIYGRIIDTENMFFVMRTLLPQERFTVITLLGQLVLWNPANMTGHYFLDLNRIADFWIAQQLIDRSRVEGLWRKDPLKINLRNMTIDGVEVDKETLLSLDKYELPKHGHLNVDYVQLVNEKWPPRTARPHFERFLAAVQKILDEPTEPTETYEWFQDHSTNQLLDPTSSTGKGRLHSHIPFAVLSGGMAPQVAKAGRRRSSIGSIVMPPTSAARARRGSADLGATPASPRKRRSSTSGRRRSSSTLMDLPVDYVEAAIAAHGPLVHPTDGLGASHSPRVYDPNLTTAVAALTPLERGHSDLSASVNTVTDSDPEASQHRSFAEGSGNESSVGLPENEISRLSKPLVDEQNEVGNETMNTDGGSEIMTTASRVKHKLRRRRDSGGRDGGGLGMGASTSSKDAKVADSGLFDPEAPSATRQERRRRSSVASLAACARRNSQVTTDFQTGELEKVGAMHSKSMRLMHLMRMFALNHSVTADMVLALLRVLGNGCMPSKEGMLPRNTDKVNAVVTMFARMPDAHDFHHILRALPPPQQVAVSRRLGMYNILDLKRPEDIFWTLRLSIQEEFAVGRKLNILATKITEERTCFRDLLVNGRQFYVKEDGGMWSTLLVASNYYIGSVAELQFTFVGTKPHVPRHVAVFVQKNWRRRVMVMYYRRVRKSVLLVQRHWRLVLKRRKEAEIAAQLKYEAEAGDFW